MCEPTTIALLASAAVTAYGQHQQGKAAQDAANYNSKMAEYGAQDALRRGEEEAASIQRKAASLKSSQRAGLAGHGIDVGFGTAQDLQDETDFFGQMDASTARFNAQSQAWNYRAQGQLGRAEGKSAAYQGNLAAGGTLLSGAGKVGSKWPTKTTPGGP